MRGLASVGALLLSTTAVLATRDVWPSKRELHSGVITGAPREAVTKRTNNVTEAELNACPGYDATNVKTTSYSLTAKLVLAGKGCAVYGPDLTELSLSVTYETGESFVFRRFRRAGRDVSRETGDFPTILAVVSPRPKYSSRVRGDSRSTSFPPPYMFDEKLLASI